MSDCVRPHRWQPTRLPRPWGSPGKNTGVGCHFLLQCMKVKSEREDAQLYPTLSDPMDCSLPGSSVHGIFQARVLEWGAIAFFLYHYRCGYLFSTLGYNPILLCFIAPVFPTFGHWALVQLAFVPLCRISSIVSFVVVVCTPLLSATVRCFRFVFYISYVSPRKSALSPRSPGSSHWRMILETRSRCLINLWLLGSCCF